MFLADCGPAGSRVFALTESGSSEGLPLFVVFWM